MGNSRIWEIDFLRGFSIIIMIYFHIVFDLEFIFNYPISTSTGINYYAGKISLIFIIVSGISSILSKNNALRGIKLFLVSLALSLVTFLTSSIIFHEKSLIIFGILHFLSISILLSVLFFKIKPTFSLLIGIVIIFAGYFISDMHTKIPYLFPIGLTTKDFSSLDYFPLIPWFGYYLIGIYLGRIIYKEKKSIFKFQIKRNPINILGKHSLLVYLIHQPIILLILFLLNFILKFCHIS
jgi:uncharacterized membrane protein